MCYHYSFNCWNNFLTGTRCQGKHWSIYLHTCITMWVNRAGMGRKIRTGIFGPHQPSTISVEWVGGVRLRVQSVCSGPKRLRPTRKTPGTPDGQSAPGINQTSTLQTLFQNYRCSSTQISTWYRLTEYDTW